MYAILLWSLNDSVSISYPVDYNVRIMNTFVDAPARSLLDYV